MRDKYFVRKTNHKPNELKENKKNIVNEFKVKLKPNHCSFRKNNGTRMKLEQQNWLPSKSN